MSSKIYPIGIQNFESLRKDGFFYIDKTEIIYRLVKTGRYYFLSRPRRFGKSLLISTLEAYFQGKKELFQGLAMEQLEKEWKRYPVLHLDLNIEKYDIPDSLDKILNNNLTRWEELYGAESSETSFPCALPVSFAVPASRLASALPSSSTSTTSPCCKPSATTSCNKPSAAP